jgi:hypothetical protein
MLPGVYESVKDGGLGILPPSNSGTFGIVGAAAQGDNNSIYILNSPAGAEDIFDQGTMVERILDAFANGATKILAVKADPTEGTAAEKGTPAADGDNTSTGTVTTTGTPKNDRNYKLVITDAGTNGSIAGGGVRIKISQNGGITYGSEIILPASSPQTIALGNGTNAVLTDNATPAGSFVEDDFWTWACTEAKPTTQKVLDAIEVVAASNEITWIHVCDASDNTFWASISALNAELKLKHRYIAFFLEAEPPAADDTANDWVADLLAESTTFFDYDVKVVAAYGLFTDRHNNAQLRNAGGVNCGLRATGKICESVGWVGGKPIKNCLGIYPTDLNDGHIETLEEQGRYATVRLWDDYGFRMTSGRMMAPLTSDFQYDENLLPLYKAVKLVRRVQIAYVNSLGGEGGLIAFQKSSEAVLKAMVADEIIDGYEFSIPAGQNIVGTGKLKVHIGVVNKGVMREIEPVFGLINSAA